MAEHTPTPWKVSGGSTHISPVGAAGGICKFESIHGMYTNHEANAAFIVKAVNSHDALVSNLSRLATRACDEEALALLRLVGDGCP